MKVKIDFVTNSSSSSFILIDDRTNKEKEIEIKVTGKISLSSLLHQKISTIEELDNYLSKESKYYPKIEKLIRIKVPVYTVRVSSDGDDPLELYMYTNMDNLDIELPKEVYMINE